MSLIIAVTSGKGGVGKSTVSAGLATAFAHKGKRTLVLDMDEGLRCLDLIFGVDQTAVFDLADVLQEKDLSEAVYPVEGISNLYLIPAPAKAGQIDPARFGEFVLQIEHAYDVILFDFPAGMDFTLYEQLPENTVFLTVATADPVSVRDAATVSSSLEEMERSAVLLLNRFRYRLSKKGIFRNIDDVIDDAGLRLIGIIPESEECDLLSVRHTFKPHGKVLLAFLRVAGRLCGETIFLPKPKTI